LPLLKLPITLFVPNFIIRQNCLLMPVVIYSIIPIYSSISYINEICQHVFWSKGYNVFLAAIYEVFDYI
jgi:hypothetical protein